MEKREIILEYDTVVIGGGVAGSAAAIAGARAGAKTLLIEAEGALGGQATIGLVTPLSSVRSRKGVPFGGILEELRQMTYALTEKYVSQDYKNDKYMPHSPHITKYCLLKLAKEAGVEILFHSMLIGVNTENSSIKSVDIFSKSGKIKVLAKNFIDATGDADLVALAEDEYVLGSEGDAFTQLVSTGLNTSHSDGKATNPYEAKNKMQPTSLFFVMRGVDVERAMTFNNKKPTFEELGITKEQFCKWEFSGTLGFAVTDEYVPTPQNRILVSPGRHVDEAVVNMSRVTDINGADAFSLSEGEIKAQLQLIAIVDFLKTFVPGFEKSYFVESSQHLGVRETRRLVGRYKLSGIDVITGKRFEDAICKGNYLIDIHDPNGKYGAIGGNIRADFYEVPFRSLCSKRYNNLLAVGRCISADHIAHSATRIQGTCMLTGQAAGTASALALKSGIGACDVNPDLLREKLILDGVELS